MTLRFDKPIIYLISNGEATASNFLEKQEQLLDIVRVAVEEKVSLVQLREKKLPARLVFELAVDIAAITRGSATRLLINDRADIAAVAAADGVHLTSNSLAANIVRQAFPREMIIGVSTHSIDEATKAESDGADFALFGPVFDTPGKDEAKGISAMREVYDAVQPFPVIGIGGINAANLGSVLDAGASGFAAIRALNDAENVRSVSRMLRE